MSTVNFAEKAIERSQAAVALDREALKISDPMEQKEKFEEALNSYIQAIEAFKPAIKWEKIASRKEQFTAKMIEYVGRAEAIKKILNEPIVPVKQKATAGGGGGDDKDKTKMSDAMQGAIVKEKPNVKWDDIAGLEQAKEALKEAVILPIKFPQLFSSAGRTPWSGIMLYGPPGTGKSYLAKAVATEADATFLSVSSSDLTSKWLGESEKLVKMMFETARENRPSIVFIDEIDSIATARSDSESESSRRIKTELLIQMDGVGHSLEGMLILCATNLPWAIDSAVRRRCQKRIYIPLPDDRARRRMVEIHVSKIQPPPELTNENYEELATRTDGFSGSDISILVRDAIMEPVRRCQDAVAFKWIEVEVPGKEGEPAQMVKKLQPCAPSTPNSLKMSLMELASEHGPEKLIAPPVTFNDFSKTLERCKPSVSQEDLQEFQKFTLDFGQDG
uniref:AAA+ ATPase domain-containing protein n=1 Tax=Hemiselmis andersenii TaxID=464988 RepID=A0A6U4ZFE5_HEMAN|mmetsp:Transcript_2679/g.5992  ORF Transcript_2679/g.5992 Transcript_2679/m.5992 type:complete len:448 (+) Transcript_2679:220-1563(+)